MTARPTRPTAPRAVPGIAGLVALAALAAVSLLAAGCGAESDGEPKKKAPAVLRYEQGALAQPAWDAEVGADAQLGTLAASVKLPWQAAGRMVDTDDRTLVWAEYAPSAYARRSEAVALFKVCAGDACTLGRGTYTATGIALVDADGAVIDAVEFGLPVLHHRLKTSNLDSGSVLRSGLERAHVVEPDLAAVQAKLSTFGKRRFLLLNAFGPEVGVDLAPILAAAKGTGLFQDVVHLTYARRRDIDEALPTLTPLDVVVWFGAGVIKPFGKQPYRSVGMTVSRGIFGDEVYHHQSLGDALAAPALGGAGLIVLAGSNSLTTNMEHKDVLGNRLHLAPGRPVVGVQGKVQLVELEKAVAKLVERLGAGASLADAMKLGAEEMTGAFTTPMPLAGRDAWHLPLAQAPLWGNRTGPTEASLTVVVKVDPACADAGGAGNPCNAVAFQNGTPVPADKITPILDTRFSCSPAFQGPYFSCAVDDPKLNAKFTLQGLLTGRQTGDGIYLHVRGTGEAKVRAITVVGAGVIKKTEAGGSGSTVLSFGGPAAASTFVNIAEQCCIAKTPLLSGFSNNKLSRLIIKP